MTFDVKKKQNKSFGGFHFSFQKHQYNVFGTKDLCNIQINLRLSKDKAEPDISSLKNEEMSSSAKIALRLQDVFANLEILVFARTKL